MGSLPMSNITPITMPKWGLTMTEGKILGWLKHEGDSFKPGGCSYFILIPAIHSLGTIPIWAAKAVCVLRDGPAASAAGPLRMRHVVDGIEKFSSS